jgi:hypothetical protein
MKSLYFIFFVVVATAGQSLPLVLNANGTLDTYPAEINTVLNQWGAYAPMMFRVWNDKIFFLSYPQLASLKRNETGGYDLVSRFAIPSQYLSALAFNGHLDTNGQWISITHYSYAVVMELILFRVADNGTIIEAQLPALSEDMAFESGYFHPDGSLICFGTYSENSPAKSASIYRFQIVNGNWTHTASFPIAEKLLTITSFNSQVIKPMRPVIHFTGNHFVASDASMVHIYELSTNQTSWTWSIKESIPLAATVQSLAWNGDDAILAGRIPGNGEILLRTRAANGTWSASSGGIGAGFTNFGYTILSLNKDTFLVSAPLGGQRIAFVQRMGDTWKITGAIKPEVSDTYYFAASLAVTDQHLVIDGLTNLRTVPICVIEPINYECLPIVELESCDFGYFTAEIACKRPESLCSFNVSTTVTSYFFANNTIYIDFEMQRFGAPLRKASVGIRCGKSSSPSTSPSVTPSTSPSGTPSVYVSPGSVPKNSEEITSNSCANYLSGLVMLITVLLLIW